MLATNGSRGPANSDAGARGRSIRFLLASTRRGACVTSFWTRQRRFGHLACCVRLTATAADAAMPMLGT